MFGHGRSAFLVFCGTVLASCGDATDTKQNWRYRVVPDGGSVYVVYAGSQEEGFPLAEPYCERNGRVAVFQEVTQYRFYHGRTTATRFECRAAKPS